MSEKQSEYETGGTIPDDDRELMGEIAEIIQMQRDRLFVELSSVSLAEIDYLRVHFDIIIDELETLADDE